MGRSRLQNRGSHDDPRAVLIVTNVVPARMAEACDLVSQRQLVRLWHGIYAKTAMAQPWRC